MTQRRLGPKSQWGIAAVVLSLAFFVIALSNDVYETTSPHWLAYHVLLRKAYSIIAFAVVAYCVDRSLSARPPRVELLRLITIMSAYSTTIEVVQALTGSRESLRWSIVDVACGALGAVLAWSVGLSWGQRAGVKFRARRRQIAGRAAAPARAEKPE